MYSIRRIIINPQTIRSIYTTNTMNTMNVIKTPNKLKLWKRNISADIKKYYEELRYYNSVYDYFDKFVVVQKLAFVVAIPASILYSIKCAYDNEREKVKEGRQLYDKYKLAATKYGHSQEYYESVASTYIYESSVIKFIGSCIVKLATEGIPLYFKVALFHIYTVNYIIVKAINKSDKNADNTKTDE